MRKIILFLLIAVSISGSGCYKEKNGGENDASHEKKKAYTCPMHPEVKSDKPGSCPICKMDLVPVKNQDLHHNHKDSEKMKGYTCPMHPEVRSDKPGSCPICKMDLVPIKKKSYNPEPTDLERKTVFMNSRQQVLAGMAVERVEKEKISQTISAPGILSIKEDEYKIISARFSGRIEKLFSDKTGEFIQKGDPLFNVYSSDLISAQSEYLLASNLDEENSQMLKQAAKEKLELMGILDKQIKNIQVNKKASSILTYYSPFSGTIVKKYVKEGMYFKTGEKLFEVANFSTLWNIADVYETDINKIKIGQHVNLSVQGLSNKFQTIHAHVSFVHPIVEPSSRTVKIRMNVKNYKGFLKPNMFTSAHIKTKPITALVVSEDAVVFTGKHTYTWVKDSHNKFSLRKVKTGIKSGGKFQILEGLEVGEYVATSGGFFLDAEKQLAID